jgi:hypothetical protein
MGSDGVVPVRLLARGAAALPGGGGGAMVMVGKLNRHYRWNKSLEAEMTVVFVALNIVSAVTTCIICEGRYARASEDRECG